MADLGIDIGSISVNTVLLDGGDSILEDHYDYCHGRPFAVTRARIADILARHGPGAVDRIAFTGTGGPLAARLLGGVFVNEIVAQAASVCRLVPGARTVIEMGGEDTKLIFLRDGALWDFVMNSICAAGTGSFLDQQARRIGVPLETEFGRLALRSKNPPRIAGRCSVFAKSDMIHLQQIATPVHDIIAGLCMAVARNVKSTLARGRGLEPRVVFQGGVAANAGMVRAFREVFGLTEIVVPPHHASMGALGALFHAREHPGGAPFRGLDELDLYLHAPRPDASRLAALHPPRQDPVTQASPLDPGVSPLPVFLGVDVGSLSTNVVLIDAKNRVVARRYLPTAGRPLEAVQKGVREVGAEVGAATVVQAAGTTGSGRYLTGDFVGADIIVNEITAQATAAVSIDPGVDTIFEIGGQDSKYVSVDHGVVVDFEMNKVCAAGTGSFLEEQAEKLGVQIVDEFGSRALTACSPTGLGDRCTVFMESDLNTHQQRGTDRDNLIAGLAYSIVQNYLTKVVGEKRVGNRIFFQGGVAYNKAVVSAFEKVLGRDITVPPHFDVTGAIGAAMIAREAMADGSRGATRFKGFAIAEKQWSVQRFTCRSCANQCEISRVRVQDERKPLYFGGRCERYEVPERRDRGRGIPNLFDERTGMLLNCWSEEPAATAGPVIGVPRALSVFYQRFPWWRAFFQSLGMTVVLSRPTDPALVARSLESLTAETCFPVEVMHGHVLDLLDRGVDHVLLPFVVNEESGPENPTNNCNCPWIQTYPFMVRGCVRRESDAAKLLVPTLHFRYSRGLLSRELCRFMEERFQSKPADVERAMAAAFRAQEEFARGVRARGEQVLASLAGKTAVVILGRSYNTGDPGLNLRIAEKLIALDVVPVPLDFLPRDHQSIFREYPSMYWPNGRLILEAARVVRQDDRLQALYLGNFRCGPDSFISHYVREEMRDKPYLQVEMDEHSADAGLVTRLEAFLDSIKARRTAAGHAARTPQLAAARAPGRAAARAAAQVRRRPAGASTGRTLYFPYMADGAYALAAACRCCGMDAQVLPPMTDVDLALGRAHTSSRECFPLICTTGSFLRKLREPGVDPCAVSFFMPDHNGPCRFGQYNRLQRIIFDRLGYREASIVHPSNDDSYASLFPGIRGVRFRLAVWRGLVAVDILRKLLQERAPYERQPGAARGTYDEQLRRVVSCVERGGSGIVEAVREAIAAFDRVDVVPGGRKPVISVVGEIFMRDNPFCNGYLVRRLEALGAETLMGPVRDWVSYSTYRYTRDSARKGRIGGYVKSRLQGFFQERVEERLVHIAEAGGVEMHRDISLSRMMELCAPYVHRDYDGDPVIAIGAAAGQAGTGISGVANILPFTCLPGTLISSVAPRLCEDHDGIPWINIAYDGQEDVGAQTRLEAFVYRAQEFAHRLGYDAPRDWPGGA
jgi:predicted CoA-substrate-specific enzyme activase